MDKVAELIKEQEIKIQLKTRENISMKKTIETLNEDLVELRNEINRLKMKTEADFVVEVHNVQMENRKLLDQVEKLEKENGNLKEKYNDIELLYEKTDRDLRDRDIWVEDIVAEIITESRGKEKQQIKEKEMLKSEMNKLYEIIKQKERDESEEKKNKTD